MKYFSVGRDPNNDVPIRSGGNSVEKKHAQIIQDDTGIYIEPTKGTNKVRVNGFVVKRKKLDPGHRITIGEASDFKLHYHFKTGPDGQLTVRRDFDFTEEMTLKKVSWKDAANISDSNNRKRIIAVAIVVLIIPVLSYLFNENDAVNEIIRNLSGITLLIMTAIGIIFTNRKTKGTEQMKLSNICPMCEEYLRDKTWPDIVSDGGHGKCGAVWKLNR